MNLIDVFFQTAEMHPDHTAIIGPGDEDVCSYYRLRETVELVADRLKRAGIRTGNCVGVHYPSGPEYIVVTYAIWRCGACAVPIAVELAPEEKHNICREICLDTVVSNAEAANVFDPFKNGESYCLTEDIVAIPIRSFRQHPSGFYDINAAFLRFTSGTTSASKGVILSHQTIYDRIHATNEVLQISSNDRIVVLLSMSYHFAVSIVSYLSFGATLVLCKNHFGDTILKTVCRNEGTMIYGSPSHYKLMARDRSALMMRSLRLAVATSTSLQRETSEQFSTRFKMPLTAAYGIIEVGLPCINLDTSLRRLDSVGKVLPAYELCLDDVGLGSDLKEIKLRGRGFLDAYYAPWQTREEIMPNGWFKTGDLGKLDDDGYLYILGRSKEVIDINGTKFFPQEVEAVLESHPAVKEACVFPKKSKWLGEAPYAKVVLMGGAGPAPKLTELQDFCRQLLAPYKVPKSIQCVDVLPRTASGKIIRQALEHVTTQGEAL